MRNYGAQPNFPKKEKWYCCCGGNWRTKNALGEHIRKRIFARDETHGFSHLMKHGTIYDNYQKAKWITGQFWSEQHGQTLPTNVVDVPQNIPVPKTSI